MSIFLRTILIFFSLGTFGYVIRKLKKSQIQITDSFFWILTASIILLISFCPSIIYRLAAILSIESPVNCVFLIIIFILLIKSFLLSIKISQLEYKITRLVEELGVRNFNY